MSVRRAGRATTAARGRRRGILLALLPALTLVLVMAMAGTAFALDKEGCLICHGDPNFTNPTPAPGQPTSLYVDATKFADSAHGSLACSSCHKGFLLTIPQHTENSGKDFRQVAIEACEGCHQKEFMQYQTSKHAKLYYQEQAGPICLSCHGSHEIRKVSLGQESADFKMTMARDSCGRCHADKFEKAKHEFHFKALSLGYARAATCFDCHGYHDNLALKAGTQQTLNQCRQCHPGATLGFTYFQMHLDDGFQNAWWGVRVVYLFFSVLLVVVLVVGIAYTTVHFQKETRTMLGVFGRGMGRLFGFIRALEDESVREKISDDVESGSSEGRGPSNESAQEPPAPEKKGEE